MDKIEINNKMIYKIANAQFKKQVGKELNEAPLWLRNDWIDGAAKTLDNYNEVVEILAED